MKLLRKFDTMFFETVKNEKPERTPGRWDIRYDTISM